MDCNSANEWSTYREFVSGHFGGVDYVNDAEYFRYQIALPFHVAQTYGTIHSTPHLVQTTEVAVRRNQSDFVRVVIPRAGEVLLEQGDNRTSLLPGQFAVYDATRPVTIGARKDYTNTILSLPRALVSQNLANFQSLTAVTMDRNSAANNVFLALVFELERAAPQLGLNGLQNYFSSLAGTLGVALATTANQSEDSPKLLQHLMMKMGARIRDPELRLEDIANAEGISTRSIRRAFQQAGTTPWGWVAEKRLQGAAHDLRVTSYALRSVTEIAFSWGFNNMAHFGRAFKNRFGVSPSEWRRAADLGRPSVD